jgi:DNA polymerase-3 subunit gamma/tau
MGQALYRKYRPRTLDEVAGQEHVTTTLKNALKNGQISHAYLFTGPRGVGKTSVARILAHEINNIEYSDDATNVDIIEIDAASNRRIDEIRELRERVYIAPTEAKFKVYIIDEVHMLTREAFNALLKTLEEPPAHVIFILATTDSHKLPATIISRTQRYSFKPINPEAMALQLKTIAEKENINIEDEALLLLAKYGDGSLRDSEGLLDQARNQGARVTIDDVRGMLGLPPDEAVHKLLKYYRNNQPASEIISLLDKLFEQGFQASMIAKQLGQLMRKQIISEKIKPNDKDLALLSELIEVPASRDPDRYLEIAFIKNSLTEDNLAADRRSLDAPKLSKVQAKTLVSEVDIKIDDTQSTKAITFQPKQPIKIDDELWDRLLGALKKQYNTLYGIVRMASPNFKSDSELDLTFAFEFHKKRISEATNSKIISDLIKELSGKTITLECHVDKSSKPYAPKVVNESKPKIDSMAAINSIFNGAEEIDS